MKKNIIRIILSLVVLATGMLSEHVSFIKFNETMLLIWFLIGYIIIGYDVIKEAILNIFSGHFLDENFLMAVASIGAFFVGEYPEALAVMVFYQVGESFQDYAVNKSRKSIGELMDIRPDFASLKMEDGSVKIVEPEEVVPGDIIVVRPGEKVPLDGIVIKGSATMDTSALTGESMPREVYNGENVISGSINMDGIIEIKVEKEFGQSTVSKILDLVENATSKKADTEKFITRFARYYTPIVVVLAILLVLVPTLIEGLDAFEKWGYRSLSFLVTSCPCALVISVPMSFFGGIGGASSKGVLIKGSNYLELLSKCSTIVFDKTGTLTKGAFVVSKIRPMGSLEEDRVLYITALAEFYSNHPISISLTRALEEKNIDLYNKIEKHSQQGDILSQFQELPGYGVKITAPEGLIIAGNKKMMDRENVKITEVHEMGTVVYTALDGEYIGYIVISDEVKEDSENAVKQLKDLGIKDFVMLTGDKKDIGEYIGNKLGIDRVYTELLPEDKVNIIEEIINNSSGKVAFVGDGINDAPVLARADIGFAMGAFGSDAAIEAADIVLMDDNPMGIVKAIKTSFKTVKIVKSNIIFAISIKVMILILASFGITNMWAAVFADVGVAFIAILNALRAMKIN